MSLIQEALHRKASEAGGPVPTPAPPRKPSGHPGLWILLLLALFLATGAALWYLNPSFFRWTRSSTPALESPPPAAPEPRVENEPVPPSAAPEPPAPLPEPVPPPPAVSEPAPPVVEPPTAEKPPEKKGEPPPKPPPPEKEPGKAARWPVLKLTGVMVGSGGRSKGSAFLNGAFVEVGDRILDARLLEVDAKGVRLEFQGEKKYLKLGQSLP